MNAIYITLFLVSVLLIGTILAEIALEADRENNLL